MSHYLGKLAILQSEQVSQVFAQAFANQLAVPLYESVTKKTPEDFFPLAS